MNRKRDITLQIVHEPEGTDPFVTSGYAHRETMSASGDDGGGLSYEKFLECIKQIVQISNDIHDGWQLHSKEGVDTGGYITKKASQELEKSSEGAKLIALFEYHIAYNINYGVPVLCFLAWKQDGSSLQIEEYCEYNKKFSDYDILSTLTQLDHPVLCRPFLTLHPCRTRDVLDTFQNKSKNPVISWLSVISPFLDLRLEEEYIKAC
ncbi:ubiquitin-like-conjugating enzyme ATG10 isoform X2 [Tribolium castaneum]|uniref:Ubiquitin-like-conjugating enzyme ATG10 n=1 Tax=Tribolium castaneum TaxID=7070 RepID=D6X345_TRICA|nr:PREDICTED: ubiquitin-like-conjugating enzyme ATG10 isoform X1 [Tribolium castaneum]EFA10325.2 Ubiquitin-like-conjugating enzyme ATG10 [Tribolium castaneum]|eukprot:XP_008197984.1 PREDICTED: ubiquitin-like-conjugating enzyme ATG10 isoform X1 [Tribolium castaneum]